VGVVETSSRIRYTDFATYGACTDAVDKSASDPHERFDIQVVCHLSSLNDADQKKILEVVL
jgi:hypothetical protein